MNKDDDKALNDSVGDEADDDTTPVSEPEAPGDEQQLDSEVATEEESQEPETVEESKKGAAARIRELNAQKKAAEERAKSLEERVAELTSPGGLESPGQRQQPAQNFSNAPQPTESEINEDGTVDIEKFRARVLAEADQRTELRIRQTEAVSRINNEVSDIMRLNPVLDPESDDFNRELSDVVTEAVENGIKANPYSASPKQIANKVIKLYTKAVAKEEGQARASAAKTAAQAALRPTSVRKQEKTAAEKSIEELEAELGMVIS